MLKAIFKKIWLIYLKKVKWRKYTFGENFHTGRSVTLWAKHFIEIGDNVYLGRYTQIGCDTIIDNYVLIGSYVSIIGRYDHNYQQIGVPIRSASQIRDSTYKWKGIETKVHIRDDVWIGHRSIILSGITIGRGSIIAAGSVVTKNVEPYSIYAGVPAKRIGPRFNSEEDMLMHDAILKKEYLNKK